MTKGLEALQYLDDIAHGRKMDLDAHELKLIVEKELRALEIILKEFRFTFDNEEQSVMIDNCYTIIFHNKKKYELLKEVLLWVI